ncbi:MAG: flavin reductase family protein [Anaerolineae bacterium]|nr:flavin reductase family protein [Anaerolineae bacterium]
MAPDKVKFGVLPIVYPVPIVLVGTVVEGRVNFATVGDCAVMGIKPPLVVISLHENHFTTQGVRTHGTFSVNFPATEMLAVTDYCGTVSGRDVDKSGLFTVEFDEVETAPLIHECPVNLACSVVHDVAIEHRHIFVARVVQAYVTGAYVEEEAGRRRIAQLGQLDPIIYALDNRYYRIGEPIGVGYQESKGFKAGQ